MPEDRVETILSGGGANSSDEWRQTDGIPAAGTPERAAWYEREVLARRPREASEAIAALQAAIEEEARAFAALQAKTEETQAWLEPKIEEAQAWVNPARRAARPFWAGSASATSVG